jgi:hypothetical protein
MSAERPPTLRVASGAATPLRAAEIDTSARLVLDLLEATELVAHDRLALVRGRTDQGMPLARALVEEGVASAEGVARILALRHQLPLVDLRETGIDEEAAGLVPLHVLERVVAIPYAREGDALSVAVADPRNVQALDELRLATRHRISIAVAPSDEILSELRRLARAGETMDAQAATPRSSGSSTRSSSRPPRTAPRTSTSSRRSTRSSSASGSTASSRRCSGSRGG